MYQLRPQNLITLILQSQTTTYVGKPKPIGITDVPEICFGDIAK